MRVFFIFLCFYSTTIIGYHDHAGTCTASSSAVSAMSSTSATGNGGFSISVNSQYTSGQGLSVSLSGGTFKGFLIYALDGSSNRVGSFNNPSLSQYLSCGGGSQSTVCHTTNDLKTSMSFTWTPPSAGTGAVTFHGVAVVAQNTWYILDNVQVTEVVTTTTTASTTTTATTTTVTTTTTATTTTTVTTTTVPTTTTGTTTTVPTTTTGTTGTTTPTTTGTTGTTTSGPPTTTGTTGTTTSGPPTTTASTTTPTTTASTAATTTTAAAPTTSGTTGTTTSGPTTTSGTTTSAAITSTTTTAATTTTMMATTTPDVNECTSNIHNCNKNATCFNTAGSFTCSCNVGYNGNGTSCFSLDISPRVVLYNTPTTITINIGISCTSLTLTPSLGAAISNINLNGNTATGVTLTTQSVLYNVTASCGGNTIAFTSQIFSSPVSAHIVMSMAVDLSTMGIESVKALVTSSLVKVLQLSSSDQIAQLNVTSGSAIAQFYLAQASPSSSSVSNLVSSFNTAASNGALKSTMPAVQSLQVDGVAVAVATSTTAIAATAAVTTANLGATNDSLLILNGVIAILIACIWYFAF